jgi:hypothetical protein
MTTAIIDFIVVETSLIGLSPGVFKSGLDIQIWMHSVLSAHCAGS